MFSLKFANFSWDDNKVKYIFVISVVGILTAAAISSDGSTASLVQNMARGIAGCIGLYILIALIARK
jgi:hypothetical protein